LRFRWFDGDRPASQYRLLAEARWRLILGAPRHGAGDAQLQRPQLQRHDSGLLIAAAAGVGYTAQPSPDAHIPSGAHPGPRIHITEHQKRSVHLEMVAGAERAAMDGEALWLSSRRFGGGVCLAQAGFKAKRSGSHQAQGCFGLHSLQQEARCAQQFLNGAQLRQGQHAIRAVKP